MTEKSQAGGAGDYGYHAGLQSAHSLAGGFFFELSGSSGDRLGSLLWDHDLCDAAESGLSLGDVSAEPLTGQVICLLDRKRSRLRDDEASSKLWSTHGCKQ